MEYSFENENIPSKEHNEASLSDLGFNINLESEPSSLPLTQGANFTTIKLLELAFINERCSPDLLLYKQDLVEEVSELLELQVANVESFKNIISVQSQECLKIFILQDEIDRIKYLLRVYIRTRLNKVEMYCMHLFRNKEQFSPYLADFEKEYLDSYHYLLTDHLKSTQPEGLPDEARSIDPTENTSIKPNINEGVFFRSRTTINELLLEEGETIEIRPGNIFFLAYSRVKNLLEEGAIELL